MFISSIPLFPDAFGGGETSAHFILKALLQKNYEIECICATEEKGGRLRALWKRAAKLLTNLIPVNLRGSAFRPDERAGYTVWRGDFRSIAGKKFFEERLCKFRPDIVLGHYYSKEYDIDNLEKAADSGIPAYCFVRVIEQIMANDQPLPDKIHFIANSNFTKTILQKLTKHDVPVIPSVVERQVYSCQKRQPRYILSINPIRVKGAHIIIETARKMPGENFLIIKGGWSFKDYSHKNPYIHELCKLPNVTLWDKCLDIREAYSLTKILFLPSQIPETFSRVILEAHINSIPVVASNIGAISYTLGKGGILIHDVESVDAYVCALNELCSDHDLYERLSRLALENSARKEFDFDLMMQNFISLLENAQRVTDRS